MATVATQTHKPAWRFERADRLAEILRRARITVDYLYRELCDAKPSDRPALHRRRQIVEARVKRFAELTRVAKRNVRMSAGSSVS